MACPVGWDLALRFSFDANRINARGGLLHMNRLQRWYERGRIELLMPLPACLEAQAAGAVQRLKTMGYLRAHPHATSPDSLERHRQIEGILFPKGVRDDRDRRDVLNVFTAHKYGGIFVTADGGSRRQPGGILGAAAGLAKLGIEVESDKDACARVERRIEEWNGIARDWAAAFGQPVPSWVGVEESDTDF